MEEGQRPTPETANLPWCEAGHLLAFGQLAFNLLLVGALLMVNRRMVFSIGEAVAKNDLQGTEQAEHVGVSFLRTKIREILFFIAQIFQFYLSLDSVRAPRHLNRPVVPLLPDHRVCAARLSMGHRRCHGERPELALTSSSAMFTIAWGAVGHRIFKEMRWKRHKELGASLDSKRQQTRHNGLQLMIKLVTFLMTFAGLGWTVFSPFISAYHLLMLGGGLYLFLVVGPEAVDLLTGVPSWRVKRSSAIRTLLQLQGSQPIPVDPVSICRRIDRRDIIYSRTMRQHAHELFCGSVHGRYSWKRRIARVYRSCNRWMPCLLGSVGWVDCA
ncbi:hypothetical protein M427DRAFT_288499 [Gonapodya prolifera JEL478]|uniref:Uncharacterized protein n=1 Tax=Gonapodya prolifera (strain JEL478) TaxID=1344416 RepID=A0A139AJG9_GONPJ|nr:hypothetical protein M427DRAFT_288499 [Gonapodya prolifera JEL478]|eukprot:KXS16623.1 hypothetical protein M427DRAFT_288499 [Gonapodya prolifera JEL478]